jgi:hypothetical protein
LLRTAAKHGAQAMHISLAKDCNAALAYCGPIKKGSIFFTSMMSDEGLLSFKAE